MNKKDSNDLGGAFGKAAPYINASYTFIGSIALFGLLGWWLDDYFQMSPVLFIVFLFLGLITGFYQFFKVILNMEKKEK